MILNPLLGLLIACLLLSLSGCGSRQIPAVIPDSLLLDTPIPIAEGRRNQDILNWANSMRCALVQSNADKAALRALKAGVAYTPSDESTCE